MPRNDAIERIAEIICRFIGGKPRCLDDFEDLFTGCLSKKTIRRNIYGVVNSPSMQITEFRRENKTYWRCDREFKPTGPEFIRCKQCKAKLPKEDFWKDSSRRTGRMSKCIVCVEEKREKERKEDKHKKAHARQASIYRRKNREQYNEYQRAYYARHHTRVRKTKYDKSKEITTNGNTTIS